MKPPRSVSQRLPLRLLVVAWLGTVAAGLGGWQAYSVAPAPREIAAATWPLATADDPAPRARTAVMFVHPQCPCTRASLAELREISARTAGELVVRIYVVLPPGAPPGWARGTIARLAEKNPAARILTDVDAAVATRFHARTSGETFVYGADGRLEFHGGITPSRGQLGANAGRAAIVQLAQHATTDHPSSPVFGCPLTGETCGDRRVAATP